MNYIKISMSAVLMHFPTSSSIKGGHIATKIMPSRRVVRGMIKKAMGLEVSDKEFKQISHLDIKSTKSKREISIYEEYMRSSDGEFEAVKDYVVNGDYDVYIGSDDDVFLKDIYDSFRHPYNLICFGSRNCIPGKRLVDKEFRLVDISSVEETLFDL